MEPKQFNEIRKMIGSHRKEVSFKIRVLEDLTEWGITSPITFKLILNNKDGEIAFKFFEEMENAKEYFEILEVNFL